MPQSLSAVYIHAVFSTKKRWRFLCEPTLRKEMHAYLGGISNHLNCPAIIVGGTEDHAHLLVRLHRSITQADWIKEIKRVSSQWIKQREPHQHHFAWQSGYAAFSVSSSNLMVVRQYIAAQQDHHRKSTFQDELRKLMKNHGLEWDERYVWD